MDFLLVLTVIFLCAVFGIAAVKLVFVVVTEIAKYMWENSLGWAFVIIMAVVALLSAGG